LSITVQFCGAARTVTGSCYLFDTPTGRLLVDCGRFQGPKTLKALNYAPFPFRAEEIDAALLTHAHIDHSGLLPKLKREGFSGPIMATRGTIDLCSYMLPDAGNIQEAEVAALNRRNTARGRDEVRPIYTQADAIATLDAFRPVEYQRWFESIPGVRARFWNPAICLALPRSRSNLPARARAECRCAYSHPAISVRTPSYWSRTRRLRPVSTM
jgi:metallo-beta-lactamase family protein